MKKLKNILCLALAFIMGISVISLVPADTVSAAIVTQNNITLSTDSITLAEGSYDTITALLPTGFDASALTYVVADTDVVSVSPIAVAANAASFLVQYVGDGSTVIAIYNTQNPAMVAYVTVSTARLIMSIPSKLGTNNDNYFELTSYEFVPYDFTYENFNDYKYTLNIKYTCKSYNDSDYSNWGCYGYFYDAAGNIIKKVHLFASTVTLNRTYHSEFDVPVNAVRFSIEGI